MALRLNQPLTEIVTRSIS